MTDSPEWTATEKELIDALADMVNQHCHHADGGAIFDEEGWLDSNALSANAYGMNVLKSLGFMKEWKHGYGRRCFGKIDWDKIGKLKTDE